MKVFTVVLDIDAKKLEKYYTKPQLKLQARSLCGHTLSVPVASFQRFFSHTGLNGRFVISADSTGKVVNIEKVSS